MHDHVVGLMHYSACVRSYVDFDIFVSHEEKFCNGTKLITGNLLDGIYFQYRTNVTGSWVTVDIYNG